MIAPCGLLTLCTQHLPPCLCFIFVFAWSFLRLESDFLPASQGPLSCIRETPADRAAVAQVLPLRNLWLSGSGCLCVRTYPWGKLH